MGLQVFDVLELHLWIQYSPRFEVRTGFNSLTKDRGEHDYKDYMKRLRDSFRSMRPMFMQAMHNQMREAMEWSREIAAPLVTTEAWGPWWHMDHPDLQWDWLRDWCLVSAPQRTLPEELSEKQVATVRHAFQKGSVPRDAESDLPTKGVGPAYYRFFPYSPIMPSKESVELPRSTPSRSTPSSSSCSA